MKKWIALALICTILFVIPACAANEPITDLKAFEEQVFADYLEQYYAEKKPHEKPTEVHTFRYYGTDNGYHIIYLHCWRGVEGFFPAYEKVNIADSTFELELNSSKHLMAYKKGKFIALSLAYRKGLVSKEAIAKAAELHAANKNAIDTYAPTEPEPTEILKSKRDFISQYGPVDTFREYITDSKKGYSIICAVQKNAPSVSGVRTIAGVEFTFQRAMYLYYYKSGKFIDLEEAYNQGLVSQEQIESAARSHAWYESN